MGLKFKKKGRLRDSRPELLNLPLLLQGGFIDVEHGMQGGAGPPKRLFWTFPANTGFSKTDREEGKFSRVFDPRASLPIKKKNTSSRFIKWELNPGK